MSTSMLSVWFTQPKGDTDWITMLKQSCLFQQKKFTCIKGYKYIQMKIKEQRCSLGFWVSLQAFKLPHLLVEILAINENEDIGEIWMQIHILK